MSLSMSANIQLHGKNFKYLPILKGKKKEYFPRIVPIAGVYPELTEESLMAPYSEPPVSPGSIRYDFSDPSGPQLGTIAVPGSEIIGTAEDPIAVITTNEHLGIGVKSSAPVEMAVIVDRGDLIFKKDCFYMFSAPDRNLQLGSCDQLSPGYRILGRVILCLLPFVEGDKVKNTGFIEEDEDDEDE